VRRDAHIAPSDGLNANLEGALKIDGHSRGVSDQKERSRPIRRPRLASHEFIIKLERGLAFLVEPLWVAYRLDPYIRRRLIAAREKEQTAGCGMDEEGLIGSLLDRAL